MKHNIEFCTISLGLVGRVATSYEGHGLVLIDPRNFKPIKCSISSVFSKIIKDYYDTSEYLTRLTAVRTFSTHFLP